MTPQPHRSSWKEEEDAFIIECITNNNPLEEIQKVISLRTDKAILKRANDLDYGYYTNSDNGLIYFKEEIKHKHRSCKDKSISTTEVDNDVKVDTGIIPKAADNIAFYEGSIAFILRSMKENQCLHL